MSVIHAEYKFDQARENHNLDKAIQSDIEIFGVDDESYRKHILDLIAEDQKSIIEHKARRARLELHNSIAELKSDQDKLDWIVRGRDD